MGSCREGSFSFDALENHQDDPACLRPGPNVQLSQRSHTHLPRLLGLGVTHRSVLILRLRGLHGISIGGVVTGGWDQRVSRLSGRMELAFGVLEVQPWGGGAWPSGCDYHTSQMLWLGASLRWSGVLFQRCVAEFQGTCHCCYSRGAAKLQRCLSRLPGRVFVPRGVAIKGACL